MGKKKTSGLWIKLAIALALAVAGVADFEIGELYYDGHNVCFTYSEFTALKAKVKNMLEGALNGHGLSHETDPTEECDKACHDSGLSGSFDNEKGECTCGNGT